MKNVQILLSTYNGERYLDEQIESLIAQEGVEVTILVRDDGSSDSTITKLKEWEDKGVLSWYAGENLKPARSYMDLVKNAPRSDYYAFCDQDDVWDKDKLKVAVTMLGKFDNKKPGLYFSNTRLVDSELVPIKSKMLNPKITFGSALIKNQASGCTEVLNHTLIEIIKNYDIMNISMHDSWTYKLCMALDGNVVFDEVPHIAYRQHGNNVIGGKQSIYKRYRRRIKNVITDKSRKRETEAMELINGYSSVISKENMKKIEKVVFYRKSLINKIKLLWDKDIKTNKLENNFAFVCAVLFNAL